MLLLKVHLDEHVPIKESSIELLVVTISTNRKITSTTTHSGTEKTLVHAHLFMSAFLWLEHINKATENMKTRTILDKEQILFLI